MSPIKPSDGQMPGSFDVPEEELFLSIFFSFV